MSLYELRNNKVDPLVEAAATAKNLHDIHKVMRNFCDDLGMEHYIYGALKPVSFVKPEIVIVNGYPDEWRDHYVKSDYMAIDPTVQHCRTKSVSVNWSKMQTDEPKASFARNQCISDARDFGLIDGVSVPLHSVGSEWGMISVACRKYDSPATANVISRRLNQLAPHLHEAVKRTDSAKNNVLLDEKKNRLTAREKEVLLWSCEGKTAGEVAMILHITERTVTFHLQNILKKLNVSNRTHAVARAISLGLINPLL